jgi:ribosomal protein L40E
MKGNLPLSPQAADDLRHIAVQEIICLECGALNSLDAWNCGECDERLMVPWGEISDGYLAAVDLLHTRKLEPSQIRDLLHNLQQTQAFYMAGTKYSVFG